MNHKCISNKSPGEKLQVESKNNKSRGIFAESSSTGTLKSKKLFGKTINKMKWTNGKGRIIFKKLYESPCFSELNTGTLDGEINNDSQALLKSKSTSFDINNQLLSDDSESSASPTTSEKSLGLKSDNIESGYSNWLADFITFKELDAESNSSEVLNNNIKQEPTEIESKPIIELNAPKIKRVVKTSLNDVKVITDIAKLNQRNPKRTINRLRTKKTGMIDAESKSIKIKKTSLVNKSSNKNNAKEDVNPALSQSSDLLQNGEKVLPTAKEKRVLNSKPLVMSSYNKRKIFDYLKDNGCSFENFKESLRKFKFPFDYAKEIFQTQIDKAQQYVYQECKNGAFDNIVNFLKVMEENGFDKHCTKELSSVFKDIADTETHPIPQKHEVDLKEVYNYLSCIMAGVPSTLDPVNEKFLQDEFQLILEEAELEMESEEFVRIYSAIKSNLEMPLKTENVESSLEAPNELKLKTELEPDNKLAVLIRPSLNSSLSIDENNVSPSEIKQINLQIAYILDPLNIGGWMSKIKD